MVEFNPNEFIEKLKKTINNRSIEKCPICGGTNFTTTDSFSAVLIGKEKKNIRLGPTIPAGMLICEKCGHIDFFALGVLGLLDNQENDEKE